MRRSWFDETNTMSFQRYYQQMASWQQAMADGQIQTSEVEAQAQRVAERLKALEPTLSDEQHQMVTDVLYELAVLQGMQAWMARDQHRFQGDVYRCPTANLAQLSETIAERFRRDNFDVDVSNELGTWVIRTKKTDGWRMAFGLVSDIVVRLVPLPDGFQAKLEWGEWTDKIISGALTLAGLWPWLVTGSLGLYKEYELIKGAREIIDEYVASCNSGSATGPSATA
jgi:hypothetical protein